MRILHLLSYPLWSGPMAPTVALALAQRRLGHTVWLGVDTCRDHRGGNLRGYEEPALPHVTAHALLAPLPLWLSTQGSASQWYSDWRALRMFAAMGVDVVHSHFSHDHGLMALAVGAPVRRVRTLHAERALRATWGRRWLARRVDGWIVRCARHRDTLIHRFAVAPARVAVLGGSIDAAVYAPASPAQRQAARQAFGLPPDAPVLGQVALMARRGQEELVAAVAALGDAAPHVLLVGRGEQEDALRAQVQALGLAKRVTFAGYIPAARLPEVYAALDAAFVGVLGNDASARAALEAAAAGLPVLATPVGALAELVDDARGYPIAQLTPQRVAAALQQWLSDLSAGAVRGAAARAFVMAQRRIDLEAAATVALYERASR